MTFVLEIAKFITVATIVLDSAPSAIPIFFLFPNFFITNLVELFTFTGLAISLLVGNTILFVKIVNIIVVLNYSKLFLFAFADWGEDW